MNKKPPALKQFDEISKQARERIYALVLNHAKKHPDSPWSGRYLVELEKSIKAFYKEMGMKYQGAFRDTLPDMMKSYYDAAAEEIKTAGLYKAIKGEPDPQRVKYFLENAFEQVAMRTDKMSFEHIRELRNISAEVFREMSITGNTRREVSKALMERALKIKGFEFTDKAGTKWSNKSYFEMLARTELMNAARASYDDKMAKEGFDVMKLSTSGNSCDHCAKYEGKLFSLTGATAGIPSKAELEADGVFHPNCTHSYSLVPPSMLPEDLRNQEQEDFNEIFNKDKFPEISKKEYDSFEKKWANIINEHVTEENKDGIDAYTAAPAPAINKMLRGIIDNDVIGWDVSLLERWTNETSDLFNRVKNPSNITLFRCVDDASYLPDVGGFFVEKGFMSCSPIPQPQFGNIFIELRVLAGVRGGYIKHLSNAPHEKEFLLDKNTKLVILEKSEKIIDGEKKQYIVVGVF